MQPPNESPKEARMKVQTDLKAGDYTIDYTKANYSTYDYEG